LYQFGILFSHPSKMSEPVREAYAALGGALSDLLADENFQSVIGKHIHISHKQRLPDFAACIEAGDQPKPHQLAELGDFIIAWQICQELYQLSEGTSFAAKLNKALDCFERIDDLLEQLKQQDN
jgi:hypothetical protein